RTLEEARQVNYRDYYPPKSVEILNCEVAPALARGESWEGELDVFDASGRRFPLWERADSIRDAEGKMLYGFGLMHDFTKRKRVEEALRESEKKLNVLLNATTDAAFLAEADGTFLAVNDALAKNLDRKKEELIGQSMFKFISTEVAEKRKAVLQKIVESKKPLQGEDDRAGRYFDNSAYPILDDKGNVKQIAVFAKDITKRKQTEQSLHQTHAQLTATLNALPDLLFEIDRDGRIYDFRAPYPELLFILPEAFLGKIIYESLPADVVQVIIPAIAEAAATGRHIGATYTLPMPTGQNWFELSIAAKGDPNTPTGRLI
ncbi:MAG: PAS domain-containing protein, partial [FCB group bacterium]|nr:PAS domain-containing protein [FCB group bacterium]